MEVQKIMKLDSYTNLQKRDYQVTSLYFDTFDNKDLDEEIDHDRMWEEDDYLESLHDKVDELKQDIERAYLDDLQNRIDNPQDYE